MATADLSIAGRVVTGFGEPDRGEILVAGGRIVEVREGTPCRVARECIDAEGAYLLPGAIDCHVHSGSHSGEGIRALTASAAAGGVTTVIDMPYDVAAPVVTPEVMAQSATRCALRRLSTSPCWAQFARYGCWRRRTSRPSRCRRVQALDVWYRPHRFPRIPTISSWRFSRPSASTPVWPACMQRTRRSSSHSWLEHSLVVTPRRSTIAGHARL